MRTLLLCCLPLLLAACHSEQRQGVRGTVVDVGFEARHRERVGNAKSGHHYVTRQDTWWVVVATPDGNQTLTFREQPDEWLAPQSRICIDYTVGPLGIDVHRLSPASACAENASRPIEANDDE